MDSFHKHADQLRAVFSDSTTEDLLTKASSANEASDALLHLQELAEYLNEQNWPNEDGKVLAVKALYGLVATVAKQAIAGLPDQAQA